MLIALGLLVVECNGGRHFAAVSHPLELRKVTVGAFLHDVVQIAQQCKAYSVIWQQHGMWYLVRTLFKYNTCHRCAVNLLLYAS